ncbi:MAG: DUF2304 domain-containing protein [Propioniciclava sp.]
MMWIQLLVILVIAWVIWFVARQRGTVISALKKIGILVLALVAVISVLWPAVTTQVAGWLGIGRGADLLLYAVTAAFVVYALTQYTRAQSNRRTLHQLARRVALLDAERRYGHGR